MDDLRKADKSGIEETKEEIMAQACEPYPRAGKVEENAKVSAIVTIIA